MVEGIVAAQVSLGFISQAAPADQRGLGILKNPLRQRHAAEPFRAAGPLVAGEAVDVRRGGGGSHRDLAETLGCIHQQERVLGVLRKRIGHGSNRHHLAGVPEQMAEHH